MAATGGIGSGAAAAVSNIGTGTIQGVVMGTAALGKNTQKGYNKLSDEEKHDSKALGKMMATSTSKAVVEGVVFAGASAAGGFAKNAAKEAGASAGVQAIKKTAATTFVKLAKPIYNESIDTIVNGEDFNWKEVGVDSASIVLSETIGGVVGYGQSGGFKSSGSTTSKIAESLGDSGSVDSSAISSAQSESAETAAKSVSVVRKAIEKELIEVPDKVVKKTFKETTKVATKETIDSIKNQVIAIGRT